MQREAERAEFEYGDWGVGDPCDHAARLPPSDTQETTTSRAIAPNNSVIIVQVTETAELLERCEANGLGALAELEQLDSVRELLADPGIPDEWSPWFNDQSEY